MTDIKSPNNVSFYIKSPFHTINEEMQMIRCKTEYKTLEDAKEALKDTSLYRQGSTIVKFEYVYCETSSGGILATISMEPTS